MRDMVLNDASFQTQNMTIHAVRPLFIDLAKGMAKLVSAKEVKKTLRMFRSVNEYHFAEGQTLWDLIVKHILKTDHDVAVFFMELVQHSMSHSPRASTYYTRSLPGL